jgi:hypothetical protein
LNWTQDLNSKEGLIYFKRIIWRSKIFRNSFKYK